jgi:hypothetical protein
MRRITQSEFDRCRARERVIAVRLLLWVELAFFGHLTFVFVVLMDDRRRGCQVDYRHSADPGLIDHPVIPEGSAHGEGGWVPIQPSREGEEVHGHGTSYPCAVGDRLPESEFPVTGEVDGVVDSNGPPSSDREEWSLGPPGDDPLQCVGEVLHQNDIRVDVAKDVSAPKVMSLRQ